MANKNSQYMNTYHKNNYDRLDFYVRKELNLKNRLKEYSQLHGISMAEIVTDAICKRIDYKIGD